MTANAEHSERYPEDACVDAGTRHDWRLIEETRLRYVEGDERPKWRRRWYCSRCRLVEEWESA